MVISESLQKERLLDMTSIQDQTFPFQPISTGDSPSQGALQLFVTDNYRPIENAVIQISDEATPENVILTLTTDSSGQTSVVSLPAPDKALSLSLENTSKPYAEYTLTITADGYETVVIKGSELLADELSIQPVFMTPRSPSRDANPNVVIPAHTLFGDYPPKIPEPELKPIEDTGEIVLSRVVIPEYIVVHDGAPTNSGAADYWVPYKDYIKNVASSEIYPTWPESSIYANILAIQSFTLNRVYTEFYRNQGYSFTITSSTAYDQKWIYGRNIYENIDYLVDTVFANYLSRPGITQPIFTSYCDGNRVSCKGLSQWGSKYLGDQGYSAIEILRYYYGSDIYINTSEQISGVPSSYPGYVLTMGSTGEKVRQLQNQLNRIARNYPAIPKIAADGIYGPATTDAVRTFQGIFHLPRTGNTDYATWYEISEIYVGVSRLSEP